MADDNWGVAWKNKYKDPEKADDEKKPDVTGYATVAGVQYDVAMWKGTKNGRQQITLKFTAKGARAARGGRRDDPDDGAPF